MNSTRIESIERLAIVVCDFALGHPTRVAVDGTTASGRSTLARELTAAVKAIGRPAVHLSMDGYHHPREYRWRRGPLSAEGHYEDAYNFQAFVTNVLVPLGPHGNGGFRVRIMDLATDQPVYESPILAPADAVIIIDGSFLQRMELFDHWDYRIFVTTSLDIARAPDAASFSRDDAARTAYQSRFSAAARLYVSDRHPAESASVVVDNDDLDAPILKFAE